MGHPVPRQQNDPNGSLQGSNTGPGAPLSAVQGRVFLVPQLQKHYGLRGMLLIAGIAAILGFAVTSVMPEPARRSLESMHDNPESPKITPPKVSPAQVADSFDHVRAEFPLVVKQVPEPRTTVASQPPAKEPLDGPL